MLCLLEINDVLERCYPHHHLTCSYCIQEQDVVDSDVDGVEVVAVHPGMDTAGFFTVVAAGVCGSHPEAVALTGVEISPMQSGKPHKQKIFSSSYILVSRNLRVCRHDFFSFRYRSRRLSWHGALAIFLLFIFFQNLKCRSRTTS